MFRKVPLAVIAGGDSAMEEALFLSRYGSKLYIIHRCVGFKLYVIHPTGRQQVGGKRDQVKVIPGAM